VVAAAPRPRSSLEAPLRRAPANLVVSGLHYHPPDPTPAELAAGFNDGDELRVRRADEHLPRTQSVDLDRRESSRMPSRLSFRHRGPVAAHPAPGGRIIVAREHKDRFRRPAASAERSPVVAGAPSAGNLSNSNEQLIVRAANGTVIKQFRAASAVLERSQNMEFLFGL